MSFSPYPNRRFLVWFNFELKILKSIKGTIKSLFLVVARIIGTWNSE